MNTDDFFAIGKIIGSHGVKGAVRVFSYCESDDIFKKDSSIYIINDKVGIKPYKIINSNRYKNILRISFESVSDKNEALSLKDCILFKRKDELKKLENGTYYWFELVGMSAFKNNGDFLGRVETLLKTGGNDVMVIKNSDTEILLPIIENVVEDVDIEEKKIIVNPPEGLI